MPGKTRVTAMKGAKGPLYFQVKQYVVEKIRSGKWQADTRIPSENELVETLKVSRMTVNRAFRELAAEGHLVRMQGVGSFVAPKRPESALLEIRSIAEDVRRRGGVFSTRVVYLEEEVASAEIANAMELTVNAPVYHAKLLHFDGNIPIQFADRYVNPTIAPDFLCQDFTKMTPNEYLISVAPITEVRHVIEAEMPDQSITKMLKMQKNEPCLVLCRTTWSANVVATKSCFYYPGSRHRIGGRFKPESTAHRIIS